MPKTTGAPGIHTKLPRRIIRVKKFNKLVMGPWYHVQWANNDGTHLGNIHFGSNTSLWYQQNIEIPFFNYFLKGKGDVSEIAEANIFINW